MLGSGDAGVGLEAGSLYPALYPPADPGLAEGRKMVGSLSSRTFRTCLLRE